MSHYRHIARLQSRLNTLTSVYGTCPVDVYVLASIRELQAIIAAMQTEMITL